MKTDSKDFPSTVKERTGKSWEEWFALLDKAKSTAKTHKEIARYLSENTDISPWWAQQVTVSYEKFKGMRDDNERQDGFEISVSKTLELEAGKIFALFSESPKRKKWLDADVTLRSSTSPSRLRFTLNEDSSSFEVRITSKDEKKSQLVVQHGKIKTKKEAEKRRAYWKEKLNSLVK